MACACLDTSRRRFTHGQHWRRIKKRPHSFRMRSKKRKNQASHIVFNLGFTWRRERDSFLIFAQRFGSNFMKRFAKIFGHRSQNNTLCCFAHCVRIPLIQFSDKTKGHHKGVLLFYGGERGIRTLGTVLAFTRFPVVRLRPAQPSLQIDFNIISYLFLKIKPFFKIFLKLLILLFYYDIMTMLHKTE